MTQPSGRIWEGPESFSERQDVRPSGAKRNEPKKHPIKVFFAFGAVLGLGHVPVVLPKLSTFRTGFGSGTVVPLARACFHVHKSSSTPCKQTVLLRSMEQGFTRKVGEPCERPERLLQLSIP